MSRYLRGLCAILVVLLASADVASAQLPGGEIIRIRRQGPAASDVYRYGLNSFDRTIYGARVKAMGGAGLALNQEVDGAGLNPGSLAFLVAPGLAVESRYRMGGASSLGAPNSIPVQGFGATPIEDYRPNVTNNYTYNNISAAMPILFLGRRAGIGLAYRRMVDFRSGDEARFVVRSVLGSADFGAGSQFNGGLDAFSPTLSVALNPRLSLGATVNVMNGVIEENGNQGVTVFGQVFGRGGIYFKQDVSATSLDLGSQYRLSDNLTLAGTVQFGHDIKFRNGEDSVEGLPDPTATEQIRVIIERDLLDQTLSVPTIWGLGGAWKLFGGKVTLAADYWNRPWGDATYERQAFHTETQYALTDTLAFLNPITEVGLDSLDGRPVYSVKDAQLNDTSHLRIGLEWLAVGNGEDELTIPIRIGFRREPMTFGSVDTTAFRTLNAQIDAVIADRNKSASQKREELSSLIDTIYQDGAEMAAGGSVDGTTITFGTGIKVDRFSLDIAIARTSYTVDRIFLGGFNDFTLNRNLQVAREDRSITELTITGALRF